MKWVRTILLLLCFVLHSTLALAESVQSCCHMADCPVSKCIDMGCAAPLAEPAVAHHVVAFAAPATLATELALPPIFQLPSIAVTPWVPPD